MRILHLAPRLSDRGGADWHLLAILRRLSGSHEQALIAGSRDLPREVLGAPLTVVPALASRVAAEVGPALDEALRHVQPDALHLHNIVNPAALRWAARNGAVVTVQDHRSFCPGRGKLTMGGEVCSQPMDRVACAGCFEAESSRSEGAPRSYFEQIYRLTLDRLEALRGCQVAVLSHYMKRELVSVGLPAANVQVIPPFVHGLDVRAVPDGPPCVLFAGRLVRAKGVDDAVAAWQASGLQLPLVFAGTGPERSRLERAGHQVLGWVSHARLSALYRRAQVVLLPSRWQEPFGIVGLEALAMGTPVAAWDSGGVSEWHPGGAGLVPWGDIQQLGRAAASLAGQLAQAPPGFEPDPLMTQLLALYGRARRSQR